MTTTIDTIVSTDAPVCPYEGCGSIATEPDIDGDLSCAHHAAHSRELDRRHALGPSVFGATNESIPPAIRARVARIARDNDAHLHGGDGSHWYSTSEVDPAAIRQTARDIAADLRRAGLLQPPAPKPPSLREWIMGPDER